MAETVRLTITKSQTQKTGTRPSAPVPDVASAQANARGAFFDEADVDGYHIAEHSGETDTDPPEPQSVSSVTLEQKGVALDDIGAAKDALATAAANQGLVSSTNDVSEDQYSLA